LLASLELFVTELNLLSELPYRLMGVDKSLARLEMMGAMVKTLAKFGFSTMWYVLLFICMYSEPPSKHAVISHLASPASSFLFEPLSRHQDNTMEARDGGTNGDPHFKTWHGKHFDFHRVCDLVLLQSKEFESGLGLGLGLDVHIRTHMRRDMSYISSAALRMGTDLLEVESQGVYYFNGVAG
jgi:hypothetical protein